MNAFKTKAISFCANQEEIDYTLGHIKRLQLTYETSKKFLNAGDKILSIGSGNAIVEKMLLEDGFDITLMDFPENFSENEKGFEGHAFKFIYGDIMDFQFTQKFDFLIACEIVEHIPMAPSVLFTKARSAMAPRARIIATTPNLGRLSNILRMIRQKPILPPPEKTFGPVNRANQATHRREYAMQELKDACRTAGLEIVKTSYFGNLNSSLLIIAKN